jgi:predicted nucleic acid-binding protein
VTLLEVGSSARTSPRRARALRTPPLSAMPVEYSTPSIEDRAIDVQGQLAERGQHRAPSIPDLLIAATAEISHRIAASGDPTPGPMLRARDRSWSYRPP